VVLLAMVPEMNGGVDGGGDQQGRKQSDGCQRTSRPYLTEEDCEHPGVDNRQSCDCGRPGKVPSGHFQPIHRENNGYLDAKSQRDRKNSGTHARLAPFQPGVIVPSVDGPERLTNW
jgi:hypothetical protein